MAGAEPAVVAPEGAQEGGFWPNYLIPGAAVWLRVHSLDARGKAKEIIYGQDRDVTYRGYTMMGNAVFLILDQRTSGTGKRTQVKSFMVNATDCSTLGRVD